MPGASRRHMTKAITKRAIEAAGGAAKLGTALGITRQAVEDWDKVPPKHVLRVEELSGISRYALRPDIYGDPPVPLARLGEYAAA